MKILEDTLEKKITTTLLKLSVLEKYQFLGALDLYDYSINEEYLFTSYRAVLDSSWIF